MAFLHGEKGFNEDRVRNGLKRMDKAKGKTNQVASVVIKLRVDLCLERRDHTKNGIVFYCVILSY